MARPRKTGMDYFPHDCDASTDEKIESLTMLYGAAGYMFYFVLLERIYRTPNQELDVSAAETRQILSRKLAVTQQEFEKMLETALRVGCFDKQRYDKDHVLTSNGIKKRAEQVIEKREKTRLLYQNRVSEAETPQETTPETLQSKVKKSKVNKSIVGDTSPKNPQTITHDSATYEGDPPLFKPIDPTWEEVDAVCRRAGLTPDETKAFYSGYKSQGWLKGNNMPVVDLNSLVISWKLKRTQFAGGK